MLRGTFRAPDDTGGSTGSIETGVGTVTLVGGSELAMSLGPFLWEIGPLIRDHYHFQAGI